MKEPHHNIAFLTCKLFPLLCVIVRKLHSRSASTRKKANHPYYYAREWHLLWFTRFHISVAIRVIEWIRHVYSDYKRPNQQIPIVLHPNWSNQMRLYCDWNINAACGLLHKWNERSSRWSNSSINTVKMWKQPKWYNRSNRTWYQFDWNIHEANAFNGYKWSFYFHS